MSNTSVIEKIAELNPHALVEIKSNNKTMKVRACDCIRVTPIFRRLARVTLAVFTLTADGAKVEM